MIQITQNLIVGSLIIILNLIPLILRKYKYITLTSALSLVLVLAAQYLK